MRYVLCGSEKFSLALKETLLLQVTLYVLSYSMEQSPPSEVHSSTANQEIYHICGSVSFITVFKTACNYFQSDQPRGLVVRVSDY
jgi:hypothetical protein